MSAEAAANDAAFAIWGVDATATPPAGSGLTPRGVRVILADPVQTESLLGVSAAYDVRRVELRRDDAAGLAPGWTLTVAGEALAVREAPRPVDPLQLSWVCDVFRPAS